MQNEIALDKIRLRTFPDPILRKRSGEVEVTQQVKEAVKRMAGIMYANNGIGLAAPQIGVNLRMFLVDTGDGLIEFINPTIVPLKSRMTKMEEGCLSVPGVGVEVRRIDKIKVSACDSSGRPFVREFSGLKARAIQHENDHLDGKLIIDYLNPLSRIVVEGKFRRGGKKQKKTCEVACYDGEGRTRRS
ncbi:MAG: peptide deformylase [Candidatus Omnitrophica bacterium]|nr:peptide deformylase [Candidatus Omnitrophota bacterium]MDD4012708.1 peptide deformylase [Candidatus Omnitrophota bacterium]